MKKFLKIISVFLLVPSAYLLVPQTAYAVCPVCTVAVIGGLGLSRYLGIDDSISGIWIGGLIISLSFWTVDWLLKRNWSFVKKINSKLITILLVVFWSLLTYPPLLWAGVIGHPFNKILGIDKLIFGSLVGAGAFLVGIFADKKVRETKGKQLFEFQKLIFPIVSLIIFSLVLYFFGGYLYKLKW